jgi:hypothetical protein
MATIVVKITTGSEVLAPFNRGIKTSVTILPRFFCGMRMTSVNCCAIWSCSRRPCVRVDARVTHALTFGCFLRATTVAVTCTCVTQKQNKQQGHMRMYMHIHVASRLTVASTFKLLKAAT